MRAGNRRALKQARLPGAAPTRRPAWQPAGGWAASPGATPAAARARTPTCCKQSKPPAPVPPGHLADQRRQPADPVRAAPRAGRRRSGSSPGRGRIAQQCLHDFAKKYGCHVELTTFNSMPAAPRRTGQRTRQVRRLPRRRRSTCSARLVGGKLIQPLNHSYIPNIGEVWPTVHQPVLRPAAGSTPCRTRSTRPGSAGAGTWWTSTRTPLLNGWDVLWESKFAKARSRSSTTTGRRSASACSGTAVTNLNTADPLQIDDAAQRTARTWSSWSGPKLQQPGLPRASLPAQPGSSTPGQDRSRRRPSSCRKGTPVEALGYWFPPNGSGPVANDTMVDPARARRTRCWRTCSSTSCSSATTRSPTSSGTGYMQPLTWMTPQRLVSHGVLPREPDQHRRAGERLLPGAEGAAADLVADALWQQAWQSVAGKMNLMPPSMTDYVMTDL